MYFFLYFQPVKSRKRMAMITVSLFTLVTAISFSLGSRFLIIPTANEFQQIAEGFQEDWGFPQCIGAYTDKKGLMKIIMTTITGRCFYSIICQGVCNHKCIFWNVDNGFPGKAHDSRVLANSTTCIYIFNSKWSIPISIHYH